MREAKLNCDTNTGSILNVDIYVFIYLCTYTSEKICQKNQHWTILVVLGNQFVSKSNVLLFGIFLGGTLQLIPGFPLILALEVEHTRLDGGVVANGGLFVETVQLQQFVIGRSLGEFGDSVCLSGEFSGDHFGFLGEESKRGYLLQDTKAKIGGWSGGELSEILGPLPAFIVNRPFSPYIFFSVGFFSVGFLLSVYFSSIHIMLMVCYLLLTIFYLSGSTSPSSANFLVYSDFLKNINDFCKY